jgi:hypothetical protein
MSTASSAVGGSGPILLCFQKIMDSKWTDVALIAGIAALLVIGVLASTGAFSCIGTASAAYLSFEMYGGAALLLIAEIVKIAINSSLYQQNTIKIDFNKELDAQITKIVISAECRESYPCQHHCTITFANGQSIGTTLFGCDVKALTIAIDHNKFAYGHETAHNLVDHVKDYDLSRWDNITAKQVIANILNHRR